MIKVKNKKCATDVRHDDLNLGDWFMIDGCL